MYRAIAANKRNTIVIMLVFLVLIGLLGLVAGAIGGLVFAVLRTRRGSAG